MNGLHVKIMAPLEYVEYEDVTSLVLQGFDGEYCIQYNHAPMTVATVPGIITATTEGEKHRTNTRGKGFAVVNHNKVVVFVDGIVHD